MGGVGAGVIYDLKEENSGAGQPKPQDQELATNDTSKNTGLALVAAFALSAVAVSSASAALPEFLYCAKQTTKTFLYTESKCATDSAKKEGEYEKLPVPSGSHITFTSTSGKGVLETLKGHTIKCSADTDKGEVTGPKLVAKVVVTFTGCKASVLTEPACESGSTSGTIETKALMGTLGYIKAKTEVGVLLQGESSATSAEFHCETLLGTENIVVTGSVICHVAPLNELKTTGTLTCKQKKGMQEPTKFEGGPESVLTTTATGPEEFKEESAEEITDTMTFSEALEISA